MAFFLSKRMFSKFINSSQGCRETRPPKISPLFSVTPGLRGGIQSASLRKSVAALLELSRHWIIRIGVIVKPFARFASVPAGHNQSLQQRRLCEPPFLEL